MKQYLITSDIDSLKTQIMHYKPEYVLYRDKTNPNYSLGAKEFIDICSNYNKIKFFLHQDLELASKLGLTGVHLTSLQFDEIVKAKALGLEVIVSTHTYDEVLKAEKLGADGVTYSPIFHSPGKGEPKGVEDLRALVKKSNINIFALGGIIAEEQLKEVETSGAYGFASIRYFK